MGSTFQICIHLFRRLTWAWTMRSLGDPDGVHRCGDTVNTGNSTKRGKPAKREIKKKGPDPNLWMPDMIWIIVAVLLTGKSDLSG